MTLAANWVVADVPKDSRNFECESDACSGMWCMESRGYEVYDWAQHGRGWDVLLSNSLESKW